MIRMERDLQITIGKACHLPDIMRIENETFGDVAWDSLDFGEVMADNKMMMRVVTDDGEVLAYICYEFQEHGVQILNMAVAPECRREGIGNWMMLVILHAVKRSRRLWVRAIVRESNSTALLMLRSLKFHTETILRRPYDDGVDEDGIVMRVIPGKLPSITRKKKTQGT